MRNIDTVSKEFYAKQNTSEPSEKEIIQSGYTLMKEAGTALFKFVQAKALEPIAIFIGGGNNGGDGLVLAKLLLQSGIKSSVFSLTSTDKLKNEAKLALDDFLDAGGTIEQKTPDGLTNFKLVVDCMLGNGAHGELRPEFATVVQTINESGLPVIAADAPTGYDSSAHACNDICIHANETMLFGFPRLDAYVKEGSRAFGNAVIALLNYPSEVVQQFDEKNYLVTEDYIPQLLPTRDEWGDKRNQGTALIIAGSKDMPGAARLCTEAALRSGAGLVTLATTEAITPIIQAKLSEPVFCSLEDCSNFNGVLQPQHISAILQRAKHASAIAIGPGLSTNVSTVQAVLELLPQIKAPTVIDADALNAIATLNENTAKGAANDSTVDCAATNCAAADHATDANCNIKKDCATIRYLREIQAPAILTPHVREFARLFGALPENSCDIPSYLKNISASTNKVILLKGAPTYIAAPDGRAFVIPAHNSGLAKGGSGDVLTGIIAAFLAQGLPTAEAAVLGALLHQKAGRIARTKMGAFSMLPSDVIASLPQAFSC
jgi:NAD(P)H-hydrate epimerase